MMKRKALLICSMMIMMTMALIPAIKPVQAAPSITQARWISPVYVGPDTYYGIRATGPPPNEVWAYKAGDDAKLIVQVFNDYPKTDFTVYVQMDWAATNVTATADVPQNAWHTFEMTIKVPADANNKVLHSYIIRVRYIDRRPIHVPPIEAWCTPVRASNFAVYSTEQADSQRLLRDINAWQTSYAAAGPGWGAGNNFLRFGMTSKARELWTKAVMERTLGDESYRTGSFSDAKTRYENALNYTVTSVTTDLEDVASFEEALTGLVDAGKVFLSMQGYTWLIASIGWLFIGIGALIYLIRRSKQPAT